jgi:dihydropyrimidine dehydrogenase (NADP+)
MPDLSLQIDGLRLPNPFFIGSGPPGTNANVIAKAFDEGWGGVVCKTICLDASKIVNVAPRYARMRAAGDGSPWHSDIVGWQNIELISDRPVEVWEQELRELKRRYPGRVLIASVTEECRREAWHELIGRIGATGVDGFELNLSCPHGLPERRMGSAIGQDPAMVEQVSRWVREATDKPVWAKLTPNITDITVPSRAALAGGCSGVSAINTILCVMGVDLETLRPEPTVEGHSTAGGYSFKAIRPIALRMVMEIARQIRDEFGGRRSLSAIGGVESGGDAAQHILLGADSVQVCTGVMIHGYKLIHQLKAGLEAFMARHGFASVDQFRGHSLTYMTTHAELVRLQAASREGERRSVADVRGDGDWSGELVTEQSRRLAAE